MEWAEADRTPTRHNGVSEVSDGGERCRTHERASGLASGLARAVEAWGVVAGGSSDGADNDFRSLKERPRHRCETFLFTREC